MDRGSNTLLCARTASRSAWSMGAAAASCSRQTGISAISQARIAFSPRSSTSAAAGESSFSSSRSRSVGMAMSSGA